MSIFKDFTLKLRLQNSGICTCFVLVISQVFNVYLSITRTFHIKFWIFGGVLCVETRCVAMAVLESTDQAALELRLHMPLPGVLGPKACATTGSHSSPLERILWYKLTSNP